MLPERIKVPEPVFVKLYGPEIIPARVSCVPPTATVLFAARVTAPESALVPVLALSVPPSMVTASPPTLTFCKSRIAPLPMAVPAAVVPKALVCVIAKVPALIVVVPV